MKKYKLLFIGLTIVLFLISCSNNTGGYEDPSNGQDPIVNPDPNGGQENPNGGQENPHDNPDPHGGNENPPAVEYTYSFKFFKNGTAFLLKEFKTNESTVDSDKFGEFVATVIEEFYLFALPEYSSETWRWSDPESSTPNTKPLIKWARFEPNICYFIWLPE